MTHALALDWRKHDTGPRRPCRYCGKGALCRDEGRKPCHKVCAESAAMTPGESK